MHMTVACGEGSRSLTGVQEEAQEAGLFFVPRWHLQLACTVKQYLS